jgi:hypothetical protein
MCVFQTRVNCKRGRDLAAILTVQARFLCKAPPHLFQKTGVAWGREGKEALGASVSKTRKDRTWTWEALLYSGAEF